MSAPALFRRLASLALALLLAACAPRAELPAPVSPAPSATPLQATDPAAPDRSCRLASDCAVRNVGNCCGYFPACVNKDAKVDPEAVRAQCAREGMSSVCGWKDIQACDCVQGQCSAVGAASAVER